MALEFEARSQVAHLTIARPEVHNALNADVMKELAEALDRVERDPDLRVVVLTGAGKSFSAGADLAFMRTIAQAGTDANKTDATIMGGLFHRVAGLAKPTVARVGGAAIGGGVGLMAACDIVVASEEAFFQFSEVRLGLVPAVISPFCVRRLGASAARRLFLTGERIDARAAERLGLVDRVVAHEQLDAEVERMVTHLLAGAPRALSEAKKLIDAVSTLPPEDVLSYTADCIARLRAGEEAREGMQAFLDKRKPSWALRHE
jgi:methylglutaconyl-CoA hydratase